MRHKFAEFALFLVSLALVLALVDRGVFWLMSRPPKAYPASSLAGRLVKNSFNFRDYEYPREKADGVFRVLAIGDSFTAGVGVNFDDVWPKRLERYLAAYSNVAGVRYQVLNLGVAGAGTPGDLDRARKFSGEFRPDLIVVGYCMNDSEDEADRAGVISLRKRTSHIELAKGGRLSTWLFDHWTLYRFVRVRLFNTRKNRGQVDYYHAIYRDDYPGWIKARAAIAELGEFRKESGIPVVMLIFPLFSWNQDENYPFADEHARLNAQLEKAGLPYVDLRAAYRGLEHATLEAVPFVDPHPNDIAQRIAAEQLYRFLAGGELLPKGEKPSASFSLPPPWP